MSREVKVDGKKAYYEYDVDRIIDEYLPQVMESAKMFPTWLPKALGKTGAAQTLGLSDRGTGFGKLTSQERIYSKEQRIDNIKKLENFLWLEMKLCYCEKNKNVESLQ